MILPRCNCSLSAQFSRAILVFMVQPDGKIENIYLVSFKISQGRGIANAADYKEDIISIE